MLVINPQEIPELYSCSILKGKLIELNTDFRSVSIEGNKMYFVNTRAFSKILEILPWYIKILK